MQSAARRARTGVSSRRLRGGCSTRARQWLGAVALARQWRVASSVATPGWGGALPADDTRRPTTRESDSHVLPPQRTAAAGRRSFCSSDAASAARSASAAVGPTARTAASTRAACVHAVWSSTMRGLRGCLILRLALLGGIKTAAVHRGGEFLIVVHLFWAPRRAPSARRPAMIAICAVALAGHTFKSCSLPKFEWAVYGKYTTSRWYGMTAAVTGNCN